MIDQQKLSDFSLGWLEDNLGRMKHSRTQTREVYFRCPFCTKPDKEGHLYFNLEKNVGFCRRGCWSGSIFDLLRRAGNWSDQQVESLIKELGCELSVEAVNRQIRGSLDRLNRRVCDAQERARTDTINISIPDYAPAVTPDTYPRYLVDRKVSPRLLSDLNLTVYRGTSSSKYEWPGEGGQIYSKSFGGYLIFPVESGRHRSWEAYNTAPGLDGAKTWFPPVKHLGLTLSTTDLLFLYNRFVSSRIITLVEGIFDALTIARLGYEVCALLSNKISVYQCVLLGQMSNLKEIVVSLDSDTQGLGTGTPEFKVLANIKNCMSCRISVCRLGVGITDKIDPDELGKNNPDEYKKRWDDREIIKY